MSKSSGSYPALSVDTTAERAVSRAGAVLLAAIASCIGLDRGLSTALASWMRPLAVHDPGKVLLDLFDYQTVCNESFTQSDGTAG